MTPTFDPTTQRNIDKWLNGDYDAGTKKIIRELLISDPKALSDAFYTELNFGTGGLRGIMGVGTNRMNDYTVRAAAQGLANYLLTLDTPPHGHSVFIGYDSRDNSRHFAEETAKVLAGNGIRVFLCRELRPTPIVSFGCRFHHCSAGIMITASHNPPSYNGYKVYWSDGGQVLPPHDQKIIEAVRRIDSLHQVKQIDTLHHTNIEYVGEEIDKAYLETIATLQFYPQDNTTQGSLLKIIYTSLHGTGITLVPQALASWGFTSIGFVDQQIIPDGKFPTVKSPNPEERSALELGIALLKKNNADILIATDPDTDRVGIALMYHGDAVLLNGNQIAALCLEHICQALTKNKTLPEKAAFVKTIGTTELFKEIADAYNRPCFSVLTGFKYIAEKIQLWEKDPNGLKYIFGGEESYGYLLGTFTHDKDAITASALICEMALQAKIQGKTLLDTLHALWKKYGIHAEDLLSVDFPETKAGKQQMAQGIARIQANPPHQICGFEVQKLDDYRRSISTDLYSGKTTPLLLPQSDVLVFWLIDGSKIMVRPSGTEPKIKLYGGVKRKITNSIEEGLRQAEQDVRALLEEVKTQLTS